MTEVPKNFQGHVAAILAAASDLEQTLMNKAPQLRGAQKKYVAEHVMVSLERQLVSFQNITMKPIGESTEEEPETKSMAVPEPKDIKAPVKYKKNINPKSVRALNIVIRAANRLQKRIYEALMFFIEKTPHVARSARSAISRTVAEIIRNLREGRTQLVPPVKPEERAKVEETLRALDHFITLSEANHDERDYLAIKQRAESL